MQPRKKDALDFLLPILGVIIVFFICLHMAVAYEQVKDTPRIRLDGTQAFNIQAFVSILASRVETGAGDIRYVSSTPRFILYGAGLCLFVWAYAASTRKKIITGKEYGTAEWGKPASISYLTAAAQVKGAVREIKKKKGAARGIKKQQIQMTKEKYRDSDILLTKTEKICMYNYELNNNTLIIGGAGSGKTRSFVLPNILQAHGSYIITDPKAEIFQKAAHFLAVTKGYNIRVLNMDEMKLSDGYNPFHYIHKERDGWEERVLTLIETIIINTDGGEKRYSNDPFWEKAERLFLQALFFAVLERFTAEKQNMNTVLKLMGDLRLEDENDSKDSELDAFFEKFQDEKPDHIAVQQYREFRDKASGRTAKSIVISASARLSPFRISEVRRIFSYDNMSLDRVGEENTAIFVIVPPTNKTFNFVAGMLFTQLFQELNYCALNVHKQDGQRLPVPCRFVLDEFANTCIIPNFVQILAYARSLGIGITTILQSLEQIKKMYKDEWGVIVDNSNTLLYLGSVSHVETLEYLSKLLGKGTYDKKDYSRTRGRRGSSSVADHKLGRELLDPSEIRKLRKSVCLLFVTGKSPFYSQKIDLKLHKNYLFTSEANARQVIDYKPKQPPEESKDKPADRSEKDGEGEKDKKGGSKGVMTGLAEALQSKELIVDTRREAAAEFMRGIRQSGGSFESVETDENDEKDTDTAAAGAEVLAKLNADETERNDLSEGAVGISTDREDVIQTLTEFAEGEAHGVPTTFADTAYAGGGEPVIDDDDVMKAAADNEFINDNNATQSIAEEIRSLDLTKLNDKNIQHERTDL